MKLLVTADTILYKTPDGKYWCRTIYGYNFWERYLNVFNEVVVVARTSNATYDEVCNFIRTDGPNVEVRELPSMRGVKEYAYNYPSFRKEAKKCIDGVDCALIRLPSVTADMVLSFFKKTKKPYALEVVADPKDAYAESFIAKNLYTIRLRKAVLEANGVSYVTSRYLQKNYPSNIKKQHEKRFESYYSTIDLQEEYYSKPRTYSGKKSYTLIHTANSINNDFKGHETVIKVTKKMRDENFDVRVIFIGDGTKRKEYEDLVKSLGLDKYVHFTGLLSSQAEVREQLLRGDIFLFPSKAEGLPRAVIEAMAVGLPCLSTPVNGIPELLRDRYLFQPNDIDGFTNKLKQLFINPFELNQMSQENINNAIKYSRKNLSVKRNEFYKKLKSCCEE